MMLVILSNPHPETATCPLPQSVVSHGACLNSLFFRYFHLKLTFESIKELGSASTKGLGVIGVAPNGGSAKVTIKARLLDSFARKETNTKRVQPWLH
jgi:hypothetical protein